MTGDTPLTDLTIAEASERIHAGDLSPLLLTEAYLKRIEELNPTLNAFLTVLADDAHHEAAHATVAIARRQDWGPLHGIPVALKDLIDIAGVKTTAGSDFLSQNVAQDDSPVVQGLRAAGAIIIGKTNLHEFAIGATNVNPHYGPARNPWNTDLSPGGSSGGSAVAVAAGMCPGALGTDTGGSVRLPSALCNLTGLRPALDAVSTAGVIPMSWTFDTVGPMARTAYDTALLYDAITSDPAAPFASRLGEPLGTLVVGLPAEDHFWQDTDLNIVSAVRTAAQQIGDLGGGLVEIELPGFADMQRHASVISLADAAAYHRERIGETPERFGEDVRARLEWGMSQSAPDYADALRALHGWKARIGNLLRHQIDVLALPVTPVPSHPIENSEGLRAARELLRFTYPISATGLPALSVPCGLTPDGLPIGLQLVATSAFTLLNAAHALQQITDWHTRRPPV